MTLLAKIRDAAVDSKTDISDVLRQCAVLAARLKHEGFKKWVDEELNGYTPATLRPPYRTVTGITSIGHFMGAFGEQINNVPLPLANVPAEFRTRLSQVEFRQGAGALQAMVVGRGEDLMSRWPRISSLGSLIASSRAAHSWLHTWNSRAAQSLVSWIPFETGCGNSPLRSRSRHQMLAKPSQGLHRRSRRSK
jgi:hypothetical protein